MLIEVAGLARNCMDARTRSGVWVEAGRHHGRAHPRYTELRSNGLIDNASFPKMEGGGGGGGEKNRCFMLCENQFQMAVNSSVGRKGPNALLIVLDVKLIVWFS